MEVNYEVSLKSSSGEITVYVIEQELAENYETKLLELRLEEDVKCGVFNKEEFEKKDDIKKEDVKPSKRKAGR